MLFSEADVDLLRLLRWCRCVAPETLQDMFTEAEISNLQSMGFIRRHVSSGAFMLTGKGHAFLDAVIPGIIPNVQNSYRESDIRRRIRNARLAVTAYRAGIHLFTAGLDELSSGPSLFLPAITRGRGSNPWGNTRVAAIAYLGDAACAVHFVSPGIGKLVLTDELMTFTNNTAALRAKRQTVIFCAETYGEILKELEQSETADSGRLISYGEAYRQLSLPVHLLSCDAMGAKQLRLMSLPDYRIKLAKTALKNKYRPAPADFPCDAIFEGSPLLAAADMDLRRIDAAYALAQKRGLGKIVLVALEEQADAILYARYRDSGKARVFTLTESALADSAGGPLTLFTPRRTQYLTEEGVVVDAPLIQTHRKTGRPY